MEEPTDRAAHQPTAQTHTTTPKRGMWRALRRGTRAAARCICPCLFKQKKKKDSLANDTPFIGVLEPAAPAISVMKSTSSASSISASESCQLSPAMRGSKKGSSASPESMKGCKAGSQAASNSKKESKTGSSVVPAISVKKTTSSATSTSASEPSQLSPAVKGSKTGSSASFGSMKVNMAGSSVSFDSMKVNKAGSSISLESMKVNKPGSSISFDSMKVNNSGSSFSIDSMKVNKSGSSFSPFGTSEPSPPSLSRSSLKDKSRQLTLESFSFHHLLGQGGYGKVLLASHTASKEQLAVKIAKKRRLIQYDNTQALIERQVLEKTRHNPFFTHLFGSFQTEEYLFFAMEYMRGGNLHDLIYANGPLSENTLRVLTAEILCGIQHLHTLGIVHRDIKPLNILLNSDGHAKIADFGLAAMGVFESTKITGYVGTYYYMAPEVFLYQPYDAMVDYFSLGIMVYEMAVGRHPYQRPNMNTHIMKLAITTTSPCYPSDMDANLLNLIERLTEKNQEKRREIQSDIREHPFFEKIKWAELEKGEAPPLLFSRRHLMTPSRKRLNVADFLSAEDEGFPISPKEQLIFCRFSFLSDRLKKERTPPPSEPPVSYKSYTIDRRVSSSSSFLSLSPSAASSSL